MFDILIERRVFREVTAPRQTTVPERGLLGRMLDSISNMFFGSRNDDNNDTENNTDRNPGQSETIIGGISSSISDVSSKGPDLSPIARRRKDKSGGPNLSNTEL